MRKIVCSYANPPISFRGCDWEACFDGDEGEECTPRGYGATEAEARQDLIDNYDDEPTAADAINDIRADLAAIMGDH